MRYFIDSSAFVALVDASDSNYNLALKFSLLLKEEKAPLLTTNFIFDETITWLRTKRGHSYAVSFGEEALNNLVLKIVTVDEIIEKQAWEIFKKYSDQRFSYTDCCSFAVMRLFGIKHVFTFDKHFKTMGFMASP